MSNTQSPVDGGHEPTVPEAMQRIEVWLDNEAGSVNPQDDVAVVGLGVLSCRGDASRFFGFISKPGIFVGADRRG